MKAIRFLIAALALAGASVAAPAVAEAQCTVKCSCIRGGCGCQSSGGNGQTCTTDGGECFVGKCSSTVRPVAFAPDGGVLVADEAAADDALVLPAARRADVATLGTATWEQVAPGHAVARGCGDVILAQWYAPEAASAVRRASRTVLL